MITEYLSNVEYGNNDTPASGHSQITSNTQAKPQRLTPDKQKRQREDSKNENIKLDMD